MQGNLCPQPVSSLQELNNLFPKELTFGTSWVGKICFITMTIIENYWFAPHIDKNLSLRDCIVLRRYYSLPHCPFWTIHVVWKKLHNSILTPELWTWLELDKGNTIRRAIYSSYLQNVLPTSTWDNHIIPSYMAATLHHAHPIPKMIIRLCFVCPKLDVVPICHSTSQFILHYSSSKWIHAKE